MATLAIAAPIDGAELTNSDGNGRGLRPGAFLSVGTGLMYGQYGSAVHYQLPLWRRQFAWAPWLSFGSMKEPSGPQHSALGWGIGMSASYGRHDRLIVDGGAGRLAAETGYLHYSELPTRGLFAGVLAAGYEHVSDWGIVLRVQGGFTHILGATATRREATTTGVAVSLGVKLK